MNDRMTSVFIQNALLSQKTLKAEI